jgi:hypothetical protein
MRKSIVGILATAAVALGSASLAAPATARDYYHHEHHDQWRHHHHHRECRTHFIYRHVWRNHHWVIIRVPVGRRCEWVW